MKLNKIILETARVVPEIMTHLSPEARAYIHARARKAERGDLSSINKKYHDAITRALIAYFEGGSIGASRNAFKNAMITAFGDAFDAGWQDGGGELPIDEEALDWVEARMNQEAGYIDGLMQDARQLRKEEEFDYFAWVTHHADNYTYTLREIFNIASLWVKRDVMVTFDGDDGKESCPDCQRYKGQRHKISWFVARDAVPPHGAGLECHPGRRCEHYLRDDAGNRVTI